MGNLYMAWLYNISCEESPRWAYLPDLWQNPKATSTTGWVDDYAAADRCTDMRRAHRVSRSSRLVLLFLCGLKLPNLWQYPKATSTTGWVDGYAAADRCTAMRRAHRVSRSSRLVLLFLFGLKAHLPNL